ncbi:14474_t:CDS:2 [Cetraspora pellucida]|uniref:14474_t:CDS:1 n=1 Tax=Cetraspora pellucida TaxID=1433469 RepID=A0A9N9GAH0_9GLOM|nr:14474_t:CDS:2 [Cetraspora pellucida]
MQYSKKPSKGFRLINSKNKAFQKQVTQLEYLNAKKSYKVRQLIETVSQYEFKQCHYISKVCAAAQKPIPANFQF